LSDHRKDADVSAEDVVCISMRCSFSWLVNLAPVAILFSDFRRDAGVGAEDDVCISMREHFL